jgi:uncharacterized membrane protein
MLELYNIENMTYKKFKAIKIVIAMILGAVIAQAVIFGNYYLAGATILTAFAVIWVARKKVKEVMADERDFQLAGRAARISMTVFSSVGAVASFIFMAEREASPLLGIIGSTLAYSICFLLLLYSILFSYYGKQN